MSGLFARYGDVIDGARHVDCTCPARGCGYVHPGETTALAAARRADLDDDAVTRWCDDGGPAPADPLPPLRVVLNVDISGWIAAMASVGQSMAAVRAAAEANRAAVLKLAERWQDEDAYWRWHYGYERPVDRARRLRMERWRRARTRRARRRARRAAGAR